MKLSVLASAILLLFATSTAGASVLTTGTMCGKFFPTASGCGSTNGIESNNFDAPLQVWTASAAGARGQLLVFFHGHGGSPASATEFQEYAVALGYDVISLDFAYGRDYPQKTATGGTWSPADAECAHPAPDGTCGMSIAGVCGCYTDCYGDRWRTIWQGGSSTGLSTVTPDWTIDSRLAHVIAYMRDHVNTRYASYLTGSAPKWTSIAVAGHSLGASLAGYIGKWQHVLRVIMMSGAGDTLAPHTDMTSWGTAYGCNVSGPQGCQGTDNGNPYDFAGCTCKPTTYAYGVANNIGSCELSTDAVGWVADRFELDGGTHWATPIASFFGFEDSDDKTCNWFAPQGKLIMTHRNWATMGLLDQIVTGAGQGPITLGTHHGVIVMNGSTPAQICSDGTSSNNNSGHDATVSDVCTNPVDDDNRDEIYKFVLTN
jgi:hypothetical protein